MNRLGVPDVSVSRPAFSQCGNITDLPSDEPGNNFVSLLGAESENDSQAQENGERLLPRGRWTVCQQNNHYLMWILEGEILKRKSQPMMAIAWVIRWPGFSIAL